MKIWQEVLLLTVLGFFIQWFAGPWLVGEQRTGWLQYRENIYAMLFVYLGVAWHIVWLKLRRS